MAGPRRKLSAVDVAQTTREIAPRLAELAATAYRDRDPDLHRLDVVRGLQPDWLQQPRMVGYAAHADRFAGDLPQWSAVFRPVSTPRHPRVA